MTAMSNWPRYLLSEIAEVSAGNPAPQEAADFTKEGAPFVRMQDVGREHHTKSLTHTADRLTAAAVEQHRLRLFPRGTLLIPKSGASVNLNHRALLGLPAFVVSHLATVVPRRDTIDPEFLYYWSLTYDPRHQAQTTSLPSLPTSLIKAASLPVPPLDEQRRIVDLLSRAEGIVRLRREAQKKAAEVIPALFLDMFGDPAENPKRWPMMTLGEVIRRADYGSSTKASEDATGLPMLRMGNVDSSGHLDLTTLKYVALSPKDVARFRLEEGDLLFNRTNSKELVGKTGLWDSPVLAIAASYFIRIRVREDIVRPFFLWAFMNTPFMKRVLFDTARGAIGQANINAQELRGFHVAVPDMPTQEAFEARSRDMLAICAQQKAAADKSESTFRALLAGTFTTETSPDPANHEATR